MEREIYESYISILNAELMPALGCTEPIAIALAGAKVREILGEMPDKISIFCSGNVIKNVQGVVVPNSDGMYGISAAATLGVLVGSADKELEVLSGVLASHRKQAKELLKNDFCTCHHQGDEDNLFISINATSKKHSATVKIINRHNLVTYIEKDSNVLFSLEAFESDRHNFDKELLSVAGILKFANCVKVKDLKNTIVEQIKCNQRISQEGLKHPYGAEVGRNLIVNYPDHVSVRAKAFAASASDARMAGCAKPVIINSGSGNQGITVSLPVIVYANELGVTNAQLCRAMVVSNLLSIHIKRHIGNLSAFCGAVTASAGVSGAITYLRGGDYEQICNSITNTLGNVGGIICDGAKSSCAAKISSAVDAAILASNMSLNGNFFHQGEGIVQSNIEDTIKAIGYVGRVGMHNTDIEILKIMTNEVTTF